MKKVTTLLILLILYSCNGDKTSARLGDELTATAIKDSPRLDYSAFKDSVALKKKTYQNKPVGEVSDYFFNLINTNMYHYWKGTPWAFYGMTRKPGSGTIACGYFVTTTLCDLGLKIDRVRLAQCASGEMIKELCTDIHTFRNFEKFTLFLESEPVKSVFIVGLDYHTGYIVKDASGIYFLHSNYIANQGVVKERIDTSAALVSNKIFMVGTLTANNTLLQKWLSD